MHFIYLINEQIRLLRRHKKNDKYLSYRDFSAYKGRRAADGRWRDLTTSSLLTRFLRNRRQESVTATGCHLTHQSERNQQKNRHRDRFEEMNDNLWICFNNATMHPTKYIKCVLTMTACTKDFLDLSSSISCCPSISVTVSSMVACLAFTASILHLEFSDAICSW